MHVSSISFNLNHIALLLGQCAQVSLQGCVLLMGLGLKSQASWIHEPIPFPRHLKYSILSMPRLVESIVDGQHFSYENLMST